MKTTILKIFLIVLGIHMTQSAYAVWARIDGIYYELLSNRTAMVVSAYSHDYSGNISIPGIVAYSGNSYTVTFISAYAFSGCKDLVSVTIPNSVTAIGNNAFLNCSGMIHVEIPNSVTEIRASAFSGCTSLASVQIPNSVTQISESAFEGCSNLASVDIPNNLTKIDNSVFSGCNNLVSVNIPNKITQIGPKAFYGCDKLTSLTIPNSVTSIEEGAFENCGNLTSLTIPYSVTSIGEGAFSGCSGLTSIEVDKNNFIYDSRDKCNAIIETATNTLIAGCSKTVIPNSISSIGNYAFRGFNGLTSIVIPNTVISIGKCAFADCPYIKDLYCYTEKVPTTDYETFMNASIKSATLHVVKECLSLYKSAQPWKDFGRSVALPQIMYLIDGETYKSFTIPTGESIIPLDALSKEGFTFSGWSEIPKTMPDYDVTVTASFTVNKYTLKYIVDGENYKTSEVEYGAVIGYEEEPEKKGYTFSGWSEIPATMPAKDVTVTGMFSINKYNLTYMIDGETYKTYELDYGSIINKESIQMREGYTFSGWSEIPETMPAHDVIVEGTFTINQYLLTYMVDGEIYKRMELKYGTDITPEAEPSKNHYTFSGWSEIPSTMPANDVVVRGTFKKDNPYEFVGNEEINGLWYLIDAPHRTATVIANPNEKYQGQINIPSSVNYDGVVCDVKSIGNDAFSDCKDLVSISMSNNITSIGESAFAGCKGLTSVTIPHHVTSISNKTFWGCSGLTSIIIPSSVISIGDRAFSGCSGLTSVEIPNNVTSIGESAFNSCSLKSVSIGNSVTSIGEEAFYYCSDLTDVTIPNNVKSIGWGAFGHCTGMKSVVIGDGITFINESAF